MAKRIQRKRSKGWKMPEGAVYVGRPTKWGNPFLAGNGQHVDRANGFLPCDEAVDLYRGYIQRNTITESAKAELRGKDLACFCRLDQPCHADVLLEIANSENGGLRE